MESDISWQEGTDILRIIYDSDSKLSDSVELSELVNLPSENVYQTTRYFLMFEGGGQMPAEFNAISLGNGYTYQNGTDFNIGGLASGDIYLYELPSSNLTALSGYDNTLYLVFATVRTNADGELVLQEDDGTWKYSIMMISDIKSLEIEATIPLNEINKTLVLTSSENEAYLDNNQILLPSVLTSEDSFRFNITIDETRRDQLLNLYNAGNLRIEFRETSTGEVADYIVTSSDITISDTGFSGDIVVYESFNNVEGVNLTPYLIYNNGKRVQESAVNVEYGGARQSFTLYKQSVASAEYAFMANEEQAMTYPTDELSPINVIFNLEGQTITWPDETDSIAIEGLNNRLSVILYDTKGKIIRTNVASYNLSEVPITGDRVITITNNAITQFLSTDGRVITTTVQATYRNAGMTESASLAPIYFTVQSEGVSSIWYDPTDGVPSPETIYEEWDIEDGGTITTEKYLIDNDFILMNDLVKVKRDGEDGEELVDVTFTLNRADMTGFDTSDLESLFLVHGEETENGITNGIIGLGNANATKGTINANLVESYTDPIYSFAMISALARDVRLVFDITDESGLVNLKLELVLKKNIDYSPLLETFANEKGYSDYLLYGDNDEVRVFGGEGSDDPFSLDTYLPISNIRNGNTGESSTRWNGNLYVSSPTGIIVRDENPPIGSTPTLLGGSGITFKDVTSKEIGSVTFYYKGYNPYGLSITVDFVLSPNYAYVQRNDYVNLSSLTDTDSLIDTDLSSYYVLCRATDLIDYIRSGANGELPTLETQPAFTYHSEDGSLITLSDNTLSRTKESFSAQLGATIENNISLVLKENDAVSEEDAFALMFSEGENGYVNNGYVNSLPFSVGYGKSGSAGASELIDTILGYAVGGTRNYSVLATSDGYELVLLENTQYELDGWTYEYQGSGIQSIPNNEIIRVQNLSIFNIN